MTVNLAHLDAPRVARSHGFVVLFGGAYRQHMSPDKARELAAELTANANSIDRQKDGK